MVALGTWVAGVVGKTVGRVRGAKADNPSPQA